MTTSPPGWNNHLIVIRIRVLTISKHIRKHRKSFQEAKLCVVLFPRPHPGLLHFKLDNFKQRGMLAFKCAQYEVCTCWGSIIQEQFSWEGKPGFEGEVWGVSEDGFALGEGGEAAVDVGWQMSCSLLFLFFLGSSLTPRTRRACRRLSGYGSRINVNH